MVLHLKLQAQNLSREFFRKELEMFLDNCERQRGFIFDRGTGTAPHRADVCVQAEIAEKLPSRQLRNGIAHSYSVPF
jgi:hypothetical protein